MKHMEAIGKTPILSNQQRLVLRGSIAVRRIDSDEPNVSDGNVKALQRYHSSTDFHPSPNNAMYIKQPDSKFQNMYLPQLKTKATY